MKLVSIFTAAAAASLSNVSAFIHPIPLEGKLATKHSFVNKSTLRSPGNHCVAFENRQSLLMSTFDFNVMTSYPEHLSQKEELDFLRKVGEKMYAEGENENPPDLDKVMKLIAQSQKRTDPVLKDADNDVHLMAVRCDVAIMIDYIALLTSLFGVKGDYNRKAAQKFYTKLPAGTKQEIAEILFRMTPDSIVSNSFDVLEIIFMNLTWTTFKNAFSDMGWWDATTIAFSIAATLASGPVAFYMNAGLLVVGAGKLIYDVSQCDRIGK